MKENKLAPKKFMGKNFLLSTETAKALFHNYAEKLPIIDYHCHVPPKDIAQDKRYSNITELWLGGDHYKWRAIRSCGVDEELITGGASDYDKFKAYATVMPKLIGNPLYHWSHLELKRYFGYEGILNADTADEVWELCNDVLSREDMSVRGIIKASGVEVICTTDDPTDTLEYHRQLAEDSTFDVRVLPAFRPDKAVNCSKKGYTAYIEKLDRMSGVAITDLKSFKDALVKRLDYFGELGCRTADHGIDETIPYSPISAHELDIIFRKALKSDGADVTEAEQASFRTEMLKFFASEYNRRGWVMQLHFGVLRNVNPTMFEKLGPDTGYDIIGGKTSVTELAKLLGDISAAKQLPRTVIYSVNPCDNAAVGALIGAFQSSDGSGMPRLMQGSAWWFNDNITGMREQMNSLANLSAFGCFLGMLTDSRSFISYPRHEYFRRILCDMIGGWVEDGLFTDDIDTLANLVMDICYNNTKEYFGF